MSWGATQGAWALPPGPPPEAEKQEEKFLCDTFISLPWMTTTVLNAFFQSFKGKDLAEVISLQWQAYRKLSDNELELNLSRWVTRQIKLQGQLDGVSEGTGAKTWTEVKKYLQIDEQVDENGRHSRHFADFYSNKVTILSLKLYMYEQPEMAIEATKNVSREALIQNGADPHSAMIGFLIANDDDLISSLILHEWCRRKLASSGTGKYADLRIEVDSYEEQFDAILADAPDVFEHPPRLIK